MQKLALSVKQSVFILLAKIVVLQLAITSSATLQADEMHYFGRIFNCGKLIKSTPEHGIFLILGDSNINAGSVNVENGVDNVWTMNPINGLCYPAREPLSGTISKPGVAWTRVANSLIKHKKYERILLVPIILSRSDISEWAPGDRIFPRIANTVKNLTNQGMEIDAILWQQGLTNDQNIENKDNYIEKFSLFFNALRETGTKSPFFVAHTGSCIGQNTGPTALAQIELPQLFENVKMGPELTNAEVFESKDCSLTENGVSMYAQRWFEILTQPPEKLAASPARQ